MCNEDYDRLLLKLRQTPLGPERQRLVKQLNDIIVQNGYAIPLVSRSSPLRRCQHVTGIYRQSVG